MHLSFRHRTQRERQEDPYADAWEAPIWTANCDRCGAKSKRGIKRKSALQWLRRHDRYHRERTAANSRA